MHPGTRLQGDRTRQPQAQLAFRLAGLGAVVANSGAVSQPERSLSAPANLSTVRAAHSSKLSNPLPFLSSLVNAFLRGSNSSSQVIRPSSSLSARAKRFSSLLFSEAAGGIVTPL